MIKLTHPERRLRDILIAAANTWPRLPEQKESLIVRFAGGWVRDKLLNYPNHDIDIALNIATGVQFATHLKSYIENNKVETGEVFRFATISQNVEQSKHLETATAHFLDLGLDFVNLRSEDYADHSRIPETMRFGTPKEDAERRDLTINSMFYNLHTESVEDCTGMGLRDLGNRIIRTPLDPLMTFRDDPLRVLRAVRFAARLNFNIVPEVKTAVLDPEVKVSSSPNPNSRIVYVPMLRFLAKQKKSRNSSNVSHVPS
jgi:tRNA nucleotidyltransferase (CCA-adding enzyme)